MRTSFDDGPANASKVDNNRFGVPPIDFAPAAARTSSPSSSSDSSQSSTADDAVGTPATAGRTLPTFDISSSDSSPSFAGFPMSDEAEADDDHEDEAIESDAEVPESDVGEEGSLSPRPPQMSPRTPPQSTETLVDVFSTAAPVPGHDNLLVMKSGSDWGRPILNLPGISSAYAELLAGSECRDIEFRAGSLTVKHCQGTRHSQVSAFIIQSIGELAEQECSACVKSRRNGKLRFSECVFLRDSYSNSCGNCKFFDHGSKCNAVADEGVVGVSTPAATAVVERTPAAATSSLWTPWRWLG